MPEKYAKANTRGSTMVYVIIIFLVIAVLSASMAVLFNANLRQEKHQQDLMEAYYLAYSGAMVAYEALLANDGEKLSDLVAGGPALAQGPEDLGRGEIRVVAEVSTDTNFEDWIKITCTAVLDRNGVTYNRIMYFDPADPLDLLWISN